VIDKLDLTLVRAARNIPGLAIKNSDSLNAYDLMRHHKLVITEQALKAVAARLLKHKTQTKNTDERTQMSTDKKTQMSTDEIIHR
ncbi:MAG: 50S ribosomal protein L4, partial [Candidatus Omnitrophota bacterium]|nr:50S ribosomal protein L4 [Candidatus Omnitrophota bacterium]